MCTTPWACRKVEAKKGFPSSTFMFLALLLRKGDDFTHPGPHVMGAFGRCLGVKKGPRTWFLRDL